MKFSWFVVILLLAFVAIFSVQNAGAITVHFLSWELAMSAALAIQLSALLGVLVGLMIGIWARRGARRSQPNEPADPSLSPNHDQRSKQP